MDARCAAHYDGIIPGKKEEGGGPIAPEDIHAIRAWMQEVRGERDQIDIVRKDTTPGGAPAQAAALVPPWAEAGVSWWIEAVWTHFYQGTIDSMRERIAQGSPGQRAGGVPS